MNELYLDDLRDKTHRGLAGCATRGLSAGGRIFGYRTVPVEAAPRGTKHTAARFEIAPQEAAIVGRIFRDYASGQSMQAIAFALNREGVHFPAQETQRRPHRRGGPSRRSASSFGTKSMPASGSGTSGDSSRTLIRGAAGHSPGPPRNGFARSIQSFGSSTLNFGGRPERLAFVEKTTESGPASLPAAGRMWPTPPICSPACSGVACCGARTVPDDHAEEGDRRVPVRGLPVRVRQDQGPGGLYARDGSPKAA